MSVKNWRLLFTGHCLLLTSLLVACSQSPVELLPTIMPLVVPNQPATPTVTAVAIQNQFVNDHEAESTAVPTSVPTPEGEGLSPRQAEQKYLPDAGPEPPVDWRPPPYKVPLSYHPDDHYWLARPIPSGSRNFDLEWYPFGNDVQAANVPNYRVHHGLDFPNDTGAPVVAAGSGTVIHAGPLPSPSNGINYYGNTVIIQHDWQWNGEDVFTLYAHTLELFVEEGDVVEPGQLIAGVGSSGEVTGPHLHFEVRVGVNKYGAARNPALWLAPFEGWGTIAGRFVDRRGQMISSATLQLRPLGGSDDDIRQQMTYYPAVASDDVFRENFVFGDVPAGTYELFLDVNDGLHRYRREVEVFPGQTSIEVISTQFEFQPTPIPLPPLEAPQPVPDG